MLAAAALMAGCTPYMTLEQAQAQCTAQGGFLVVIYTQKFTRSTIGPVVASPDKCVMPKEFDKPGSAPPGAAPLAQNAAAPVAAPAAAPAKTPDADPPH
jgi:hypothetical protein